MESKFDTHHVADKIVAGGLLMLFSPAWLTAVAVSCAATRESPFFCQPRYGLHGKSFNIYKIRTMRTLYGADGKLLPDDQRTPPAGTFLRRFSLDELPQLWNIVKGDMVFIGPRPLIERYDTKEWAERESVRPGVYGLKGITEKEKGVSGMSDENPRLDLNYIRYRQTHSGIRTLAFDLELGFRAACIALTGRADHGKPERAAAERKVSIPENAL